MRYLASAHPNLVWRAILGEPTNDCPPPYRVTALICMGANPLVTYANTQLVHRALRALELLVVLEYYMTPTAQLADFVLPSAGAFERPQFQAHGGVSNFAYGGAAAVQPYYQRKCDYEFWRELGCHLGQAEHWPQATLQEAIQATLAPTGMTWQQWQAAGIYYDNPHFYKHEQVAQNTAADCACEDASGKGAWHENACSENWKLQGFATTTGKIELVSAYLQQLGSTPLPVPAKTAEPVAGQLTLITGARKQPYWASSYFNNTQFRAKYPHPQADISAATLQKLGIAAGQWVVVRTAHGQARFVATESELADDVVSVDYGWWFPEETPGNPHLSGAFRSNANMLTSGAIEDCEPLIGSWTYNGIPCTVVPEPCLMP
jgi:anaerobic selenocysteine-containing dehydrogenase